MFTPVDLETMVFRRGFRGYRTKEVQEFMRKLIVDYEKLYKENIDLREELDAQKELLKNYKQMEETLKNTLYLAQGTAEEIKAAGEKQAEVILREAQNRAEQMRLKVREEIQSELQELANLKQQVDLFRIQFTRFLNSLIEMAEQHLDIEGIWDKMVDLSRHNIDVRKAEPEKVEESGKIELEKDPQALAAAKAKAASLFETTE
ncbi:MAG TPA: DivIVA domain-containing protein [Firmicutes bacterium]|nr:DivIVA domain-containing protein [Bacillota bacterium]